MFIANNLNLVTLTCDRVGLLYKGQIVEQGLVKTVVKKPENDYTKMMLQSLPEKEKNDKYGEILLRIDDLKKYYPIYEGFRNKATKWVKAADGISFQLDREKHLEL